MGKSTAADPSGQRVNRNKAARKLINRLARAEKSVLAMFRAIPRTRRTRAKIANAEATVYYEYDYSAQSQEDMARDVQFVLNRELLETQNGEMPFDWYWKDDIDRSVRQGTMEEVRDFNQMTAAAIAAGLLLRPVQPVPVEQVVFSDDYRNSVRSAEVGAFQSVRTISDRTASQVLQRINAGVNSGKSPIVVARDIKDRFDVADSSAIRTAVTEINQAYNTAKMDSTRILGAQTGLRTGVVHISALLPTTRAHHAARHGNAYSLEDQLSWWSSNANRVNCKCSTRSILIDSKGNVMQGDEQEQTKSEGREFFG